MATNTDSSPELTPPDSPILIPNKPQILKTIDDLNPSKIKKASLLSTPISTPGKQHGDKTNEDGITPTKIKEPSLLYTPISTPEKRHEKNADEDYVTPTKRRKRL
ncbi:hypothetical protein SNE40_003549 [Patella caerulea]|uniref:Uncharacterized protein n=1 Tax=Patella caerulea TaxID=87958 RepID=A0AAN8K846_PATCE